MARSADHRHIRPGFGARLRHARGEMTMHELGTAAGISAAYILRIVVLMGRLAGREPAAVDVWVIGDAVDQLE
ncbi:MAG TPA: hypothetical protein VLJ44_07770 [Gaiellaceae bacterium]|nr:hypothetical protein [Gaiellaceae bacterium]